MAPGAQAGEPGDTTITLFDGIGVLEDITEYALGDAAVTPTEDRIIGLAASHALGWLGDSLSIEAETQAVYHYGRGNFGELGATLVARFDGVELPDWLGGMKILDGFSIGVGPSVTTAIPPLESDRGRISHVLNQLMLEYLDPMPEGAEVQTVERVHHRSGIFGLINGIVGGSDYLGRGIRFRF
ncbi:MAG: hypothetical protein R3F55_00145 [Alphaproteobacteria bacterium]